MSIRRVQRAVTNWRAVTGLVVVALIGSGVLPAEAARPTPSVGPTATAAPSAANPAAPSATATAAPSAGPTATAAPTRKAPKPAPTPTTSARAQAPAGLAADLAADVAGAASFAYDPLGRLVGMVAADGAVARWSYDANGNVTAVIRLGTPAVAVLSAVPTRVRPGQSLTLSGKGFSAAAASNTVKVNGAAATVTRADATRLVVTVPAAATSGAVDVTTAAGSASLPGITVLRGDLPTVTSFAPVVAKAGDTVTAQVTNPDPAPANNRLLVNGLQATVTAQSPTSLSFTVPAGAGSGRLTVATPAGNSTSVGDLVIPPVEFDPTSVNAGSRIGVGTRTTVAVPVGKVVPRLFDAADGERFAVRFENGAVSCLGAYLYNPVQVGDTSTSCLYTSGWVETSPVSVAGTRTLYLRNGSASAGSVDVTVIRVPADANLGAVTTNGTAKSATITAPGQNGYLTFSATSGQQIAVRSSATTVPSPGVGWSIHTASGLRVGNTHYGDDWQDTVTLPTTGSYQLRVDPLEDRTGSVTFKAWLVSGDANLGALTLDGTPKTAALANPGQNARLTFSGTAGQRVALRSADTSAALLCCYVYWALFSPAGDQVGSTRYGDAYQDTVLLPETGTYQIRIDPYQELTGSMVFRGWSVPADANLGAVTTNGTAKTVAFTNPGRNGYLTLTATAGQYVAVETSAVSAAFICCSLTWGLQGPDGEGIGSTHYAEDFQDGVLVPTTGTYRIRLDPTEDRVGSVTVRTWVVSGDANLGVLSTNGTPRTATFTNPGQNGYFTFAGTAGQRIALRTTDASEGSTYLGWGVYRPDGQLVGVSHYGNAYQDTVVLPSTGTYQVRLDPERARTGSIAVRAWLVPADVNLGAVTLNGTPKIATIAGPGQNGYLTFTGTAGQRVAVESSAASATFVCCMLRWVISSLDAGSVGAVHYAEEFQDSVVLPATGTYRIMVDPQEERVGSVTFKAWSVAVDADLGALATTGAPKVATIGGVGQNGYLTFTATIGRGITLTSSALTGGIADNQVTWSVRRLNGSLAASNYGATTVTFVPDISGPHRLYIDPAGTRTGSITFTATPATPAAAAAAAARAERRASREVAQRRTADRTEPRAARGRAGSSLPKAASSPAELPPDPFVNQLPTTAQWHPDESNTQGLDWLARREPARAEDVEPLKAPVGETALSGLVLDLDGWPVAGVTVRTGTARTTTDGKGRFLVRRVSPTSSFVVVDGRTVDAGSAQYGTFRIHVRPKAGRTVGLDATVWLPRLDLQHTRKLAAPTTKETVLTTPDIPGLEVRIPAGSVVKDADGKVVTELGITAVPLDRPPFPLPRNGIVPVYFTIQPGGGSIFPQGAQVVYPNYTKLPPGTGVDFYNYDPAEKGWYVYGHGQVSADGKQVVPDAKTRIWNLDGSMFNTGGNPRPGRSTSDNSAEGDPVNLSTGLMTDRQTDLAVGDVMPIDVTRSYWQGDGNAREFGLNQAADYNLFLVSENQYQEVDLYLPGGGKVHYVRTSPGTSYSDAVFTAVNSPARYRGSTISQEGDWALKLRDGTKYLFPWYSRARAVQDRNGNQVTFTRAGGSNGEVTRITSPNGRWIALEYDASNRVASATDNIGRTVSYTYDASGRLATVTDVAGRVQTYTYDATNRIVRIKDVRGTDYLSVTYDANGRVATQAVAGQGTYRFTYLVGADGVVTETRVTQPSGAVRRVVFNAAGMPTSDTRAYGTPSARTTTLTRGANQRIDAETDPFGRKTAYTYDSAGRPTATTVLAGTAGASVVAKVTYDASDQPLTTTDAVGKVTKYGYDGRGNLTTITQPTGWATRLTHRADGQVSTVTDTAGQVTTLRYFGGDLVSTTDPLGQVSRQFVDAAGRIGSTTDPIGASTLITYDTRSQPTKVVDALGGTTSMAYDATGNLTQLTDPRGGVSRWTYDSADRVLTAVDPLTRTTSYAYDAAGRPTSTVARSGLRATFAYDVLGRPTLARYGVTATGQQSSVTYAYDTRDRVASLTDTAGGTTSFGYDEGDRTTSTTGPKGTVAYAFDAAGRVTSMKAGGSAAVTYGYNDASQLVSLTQGPVASTIAHDAAGRTGAVSLPNGWRQAYTYDAAGQVTGITYTRSGAAKGGLTYTYDASGRSRAVGGALANSVLPAARSALTYDAANRLTKSGTATLTYDADGNLTGDGTTTYQWDARGQLTRLARTGLTASFGYDATGRRTSRTVGTAVKGFLNGRSNVADELTSTGANAATLLSAGTDEWLARTASGTTDAVLTDALGSPVALGAADGTLAAKYTYDPYGVQTATGAPRGSDLGFTGRQNDGTGLMYYRARYYSPALQRFISEDPIRERGSGTNLYQYVNGQPTSLTDPSGLSPGSACDDPDGDRLLNSVGSTWGSSAGGIKQDSFCESGGLGPFETNAIEVVKRAKVYVSECRDSAGTGALAGVGAGVFTAGFFSLPAAVAGALGGCAEGAALQLIEDVYGKDWKTVAQLGKMAHDIRSGKYVEVLIGLGIDPPDYLFGP